jgi:sporulation protein YlmC with PRC-barrel domain
VAGATTTVGVTVTESTQLALGWSVKKSLLGKTVYNEAGQKIGRVEDLIISPERNLSYVIVGAGGFVGIGRHDVAIAMHEILDRGGRLVIPGATPQTIKALPGFAYTNDMHKRDLFVAQAEKDIAAGKARVSDLAVLASNAATDAKGRLGVQITALEADVKASEARLSELKQAAASRWREFQTGVSEATARLRKAVETAAA